MSKEKHHHHEEHKHEEHEKVQNAVAQENEKKENAEVQKEKTLSAEEKISELEKQIDGLKKENADLKDQVLRRAADFDNYRKRTIKEKSELILNGGQKVLESLLPVLDDLERAQTNMDKSDDVATLKEGVELIIDKLTKTLSTQGLSKIETDGSAFDTDFHEAIALVPVEDESKKNQIIDCVQTGYTLNGKVIRHAKVAVGQ